MALKTDKISDMNAWMSWSPLLYSGVMRFSPWIHRVLRLAVCTGPACRDKKNAVLECKKEIDTRGAFRNMYASLCKSLRAAALAVLVSGSSTLHLLERNQSICASMGSVGCSAELQWMMLMALEGRERRAVLALDGTRRSEEVGDEDVMVCMGETGFPTQGMSFIPNSFIPYRFQQMVHRGWTVLSQQGI